MPYGQGTHRDFVYKLSGKTTGKREFDYTLDLKFSNSGDGIQKYDATPIFGSQLKLPHDAPINGYQPTLKQ